MRSLTDKLNDLISTIYNSALLEDSWNLLMTSINRHFDGQGIDLIMIDSNALKEHYHHDIDEDAIRLYGEHLS